MLRAASVGLGWWSDELARAVQGKSDRIGIVSCTSRSPEKRSAFAGDGASRVAPAEAMHNVAVMQSTAKSAAQDGRAVELPASEV